MEQIAIYRSIAPAPRPFSDGNKRIGSFLFVWYLELNRYLRRKVSTATFNGRTSWRPAVQVCRVR